MDNVTVQSTPSNSPPPKIPQTQLISVRVLVTAASPSKPSVGVPAYNQFYFQQKLPIQNAKNNRTIQSSGCALCPWASTLAAAGCCAPSYDTSTKKFSAGTTPIDPGTLLNTSSIMRRQRVKPRSRWDISVRTPSAL
jgi:hypothetical protein